MLGRRSLVARGASPRPRVGALVAVVIALATAAQGHVAAAGSEQVRVERLAGPDRVATAVAVARTLRPVRADATHEIVVAAQATFPDALSAATLSRPVLLTAHDRLPDEVRTLLSEGREERPEGTNAYLVGGIDAVGDQVVTELEELGYGVERIAGPNRYSTAARVAQHKQVPVDTVVLVSGESFADALAAGSIVHQRQPLLLTRRDALPPETEDALLGLSPERAIIVGGPAAVSENVVAQLKQRGISTMRLSGSDRLETAVAVARERVKLTYDQREGHELDPAVLLVRGDAFPDGLSASGHATAWEAPILLTASPEELGSPTRDYLREIASCPLDLRLVGGAAAIGEAVVAGAREAATPSGGCTRAEIDDPRLVRAFTEPYGREGETLLVLEWSEPVQCPDPESVTSVFEVRHADGERAVRGTGPGKEEWDCNSEAAASTMEVAFFGDPSGGTVTYRDVQPTYADSAVYDAYGNLAHPREHTVPIED